MSGREFDKAIQERAQQLRLDPSPEVWEKVSANLDRRRKRRVVAWLFSAAAIFSGLITIGYLGTHQNEHSVAGSGALPPDKAPMTKSKIQSVSASPLINQQSTASDKKSTQLKGIAATKTNIPYPAKAYLQPKSSHNKKSAQVSKEMGSPDSSNDPTLLTTTEPEVAARTLVPSEIGRLPDPEGAFTVKENKKALRDRLNRMQEKKADEPVADQSLWSGDLYFAAGVSPLVSLQSATEANSGSASLSLINNPTASVSLPGNVSAVRPAGAYQLGINISRKINRRLTAISGIRYAYFANQISVGETVNTAVPVYNDRMERLNATAIYTGNGKKVDYTNQFHFLQIPVELGIGLGRKQLWNVQSGFVFGYLVHSNALLYNHVSGVYYSDNDVIRKWQAGVSSRITYRVVNSRQFSMELGPFVQYQLSPLYAAPQGQHLLAAGLSGRILLKK